MDENMALIPSEQQQLVNRVSQQISLTDRLLALQNDDFPELIPYRKSDKWGFCDRNKKIVIDCIYEDAGIFSEGLSAVAKDGKWGFIDINGKIVIDFHYQYAYRFYNERANVKLYGDWIFIDKNGDEISRDIDIEYYIRLGAVTNFRKYSDGFYRIFSDKKWTYQDMEDNLITPLRFDDAYDFNNDMARVKKNNLWGFINKSGDLIVPCEYDEAKDFSNGFAAVRKNKKWGFIDKKGNITITFTYDKIADFFSEDFIGVCINSDTSNYANDKWGFIDFSGKQVIPLIYEEVFSFSEGLAAVKDIIYLTENGFGILLYIEEPKFGSNKLS
jgi:hypothetical protein